MSLEAFLSNSSLPTISTGTGESATERGAEREPTTAIRSMFLFFAAGSVSAAKLGAVPNARPTARASVPVRNFVDMLFPS